jgi:hypothetical protein
VKYTVEEAIYKQEIFKNLNIRVGSSSETWKITIQSTEEKGQAFR